MGFFVAFELEGETLESGYLWEFFPWTVFNQGYVRDELVRLGGDEQVVDLDGLAESEPEHPFARLFGADRIRLSY